MGGRGSSSGAKARDFVNSIRNSGVSGPGVALSITNRMGGERQTIAPGYPGESDSFRVITSRGTAKISRQEAIKYVNSAMGAGYVVKKV